MSIVRNPPGLVYRFSISYRAAGLIGRDQGRRRSPTPPNTHTYAHERLQRRPTVDPQIFIPFNHVLLEQTYDRRAACDTHATEKTLEPESRANQKKVQRTERKVPKLLTSLDKVALRHRRLDTADHHRADTHRHDAPKLRAVDRHDLAHVLAINVQRRPDRLRLQQTFKRVSQRICRRTKQATLLTFTV